MIQFKCRQWLVLWSILAASFFSCFVVSSVNAAEGTALGIEISGHRYRNLDDVFVFPAGGRQFDSELWKREPSSRFAMLFDLYHQPLNKKTPEQIYELLGAPSELKVEHSGSQSAYYDLGLQNGLPTFLVAWFKGGRLDCFSLQQRSNRGVCDVISCSEWQIENLSWKTIAREYNQQCLVVGMPVKLIAQVTGFIPADTPLGIGASTGDSDSIQAVNERKLHHFGPFEFEYSIDQARVKRFRYALPVGSSGYTDWEEEELAADWRSSITESEYSYLYAHRGPFLEALIPFSEVYWKGCKGTRPDIHFRHGMVGGLARTYPLIGMKRADVHALLGQSFVRLSHERLSSSRNEKVPSPAPLDLEDYQVTASACGNAQRAYFELLYKAERVVAYRVISVVPEGNGERKFSNGCSFHVQ